MTKAGKEKVLSSDHLSVMDCYTSVDFGPNILITYMHATLVSHYYSYFFDNLVKRIIIFVLFLKKERIVAMDKT